MLRSNDADLLSGERQPGAIDAVTSVIAPWQTLSALATETGQAVRQKLTHSGAGVGKGHVQQGVQQDPTATADGRPWPDESTTLSHSAQVSAAQRKAKSVETSGHIDQEAIQANISQVQRKMVSTDAATEVVLRFNFMSARESKVRDVRLAMLVRRDVMPSDDNGHAGCLTGRVGLHCFGSRGIGN